MVGGKDIKLPNRSENSPVMQEEVNTRSKRIRTAVPLCTLERCQLRKPPLSRHYALEDYQFVQLCRTR